MNSYQGILITDGSRTYAAFIYNCSQLNRDSVAGIGYFFNSSLFEEHAVSNTDQSSMVACSNSLCSPSLVVYPLFGMYTSLKYINYTYRRALNVVGLTRNVLCTHIKYLLSYSHSFHVFSNLLLSEGVFFHKIFLFDLVPVCVVGPL